jgi:hypothetical protein
MRPPSVTSARGPALLSRCLKDRRTDHPASRRTAAASSPHRNSPAAFQRRAMATCRRHQRTRRGSCLCRRSPRRCAWCRSRSRPSFRQSLGAARRSVAAVAWQALFVVGVKNHEGHASDDQRWRRFAGRSPLRLSRRHGWRQHHGQSRAREPSWRSWMGVDWELADTRCFGLSVIARQRHGDSATVAKEVRRE